ncbi:uncharacterized protein LAJ45_05425 [Morchella importuna]|uniref:uncharacterized protein n=1 Tax=Morchella importuna TaxID=1174673 RepID=UPI001E8DE56C|nr:uncharacterized protein LAJ45_05425 [Morchella importuna]KAH8150729.1 hypothetical protein LAJ45_05425 [Morchella importuna]
MALLALDSYISNSVRTEFQRNSLETKRGTTTTSLIAANKSLLLITSYDFPTETIIDLLENHKNDTS